MSTSIQKDNYKIFSLLSHYLNEAPDFVTEEEIGKIIEHGVSPQYAFSVILAAAFGLDIVDNQKDKEFFQAYFNRIFHELDTNEYAQNPYYKNIKIPTAKIGDSELKYEHYKSYEGFVCDDIIQTKEGRQIPQIGFFKKVFEFPAVLEKGQIWMTITPNEIETMKEPIADAHGNVLTFGLGLGYYAYMAAEKENVTSVTIVDSNEDVIQLFSEYILPQFRHREKIRIVKADAFEFAEHHMTQNAYDFVFTDLWHDVSDGLDLYVKMKQYETNLPKATFAYWIEKSIRCYL